MQGRVGYADALKILGVGQNKTLDAIGRLVGGVIVGATVATGQLALLHLLAVRDELVTLSGTLLARFGQRVRGASGKGRTDLLAAAHSVIAVNAYFVALRDDNLPINIGELDLAPKPSNVLMLLNDKREARAQTLVDTLLQMALPIPTPQRPYEQTVIEIKARYRGISEHLLEFIQGLALWERLDSTKQSMLRVALLETVPAVATTKYEEKFRQLASECPEFSTWIYLTDGVATRAMIRRVNETVDTGLFGLQQILRHLASNRPADEWPDNVNRVYQEFLKGPIAETSPGEALSGLVIPSLSGGYINPRFRVRECNADARPAEEKWWDKATRLDDVEWFLTGYLTSPESSEIPLVLLGQPGSGKSLFTKVLAARLTAEDYLPVRVELRRVDGDAPIQDQIESTLREITGKRMEWPGFVQAAGGARPVVMLDGFDELLQGTGVSHSDYLEQVRAFQQRELVQGRQVIVIVTSRTVVANRVRFPEGTIVVKMEPFEDDQISHWLAVWNGANSAYLTQSNLNPLPLEAVLIHRDLAEHPLLLLMLSFYDADGNALQQHYDELGRADLYEGLLTKFVDREIDKLHPSLDQHERRKQRNLQLYQLSIVAFSMFNRGRKAVTEPDLDADLGQLLSEDNKEYISGRMARPLTQGQLTVAKFFFIHQSEAMIDNARLYLYEFLHATFGEYLVARLVFDKLNRLIKTANTEDWELSAGTAAYSVDNELWDFLSFTSLSDDPQTLGFLAELTHELSDDDLATLRGILSRLFRSSLRGRRNGYSGYEPRRLAVTARHAAYSVNLLILNVLASNGPLRVTHLFLGQDNALSTWQSFTLLWRSQLDPSGWDSLTSALRVSHVIDGDSVDLTISYERGNAVNSLQEFKTVNWLAAYQSANIEKVHGSIRIKVDIDKIARQAMFLCVPELDLLLHSLQPLLSVSPDAFGNLLVGPNDDLRSVMQATLGGLCKRSSGERSSIAAQKAWI